MQLLDADGDGKDEWIVFYRFDLVEGATGRQFSPIGAAVYNDDHGDPPVMFPYELHPPDRIYLGEQNCVAEVRDLITTNAGLELLVRNFAEEDLVVDLSVFYWYDHDQDDLSKNPSEEQQGYECLGFFHGNGGITLAESKVIVRERTEERNQLSVKKVYDVREGSYFQPGGRELWPPVETSIEFAFGVPEDVAQSPYPEKVVLAFYLALGQNNPLAQTYLSEASGLKNVVGSDSFGTAASGDQIQKVLVKRIIYTPDREKEERHEPIQVIVSVSSVTSEGEDPPFDVTWEVIWESGEDVAKPGWKLHRMIMISPPTDIPTPTRMSISTPTETTIPKPTVTPTKTPTFTPSPTWTPTSTPVTPSPKPLGVVEVWDVDVNPKNNKVIYAVVKGQGIYRSTDGGYRWEQIYKHETVESLTIDPKDSSILYAAIWDGILKSMDGGATWELIAAGKDALPGPAHVLAIPEGNNQIIYAGIERGVYRSSNGGLTWEARNKGMADIAIYTLVIGSRDGNLIYAAGKGAAIWKSIDGGSSPWEKLSSGYFKEAIYALALHPANNQWIYAGSNESTLVLSTDGGHDWLLRDGGLKHPGIELKISALAIDPRNPNVIYAGTGFRSNYDGHGIYKSTDGGLSWKPINNGLPIDTTWLGGYYVQSIAMDPNDSQTIYAASFGGLYKSTDGGQLWKRQ